jgi:hypothetical protein
LLFLFAIVLGLAGGLALGGRIENLSRIKFRWPWLVIVAVVVREAVLLTPLNRVNGAQYLYVLALAGIGVWTALHWDRMRGIQAITVGIALNLLVILANNARMPVAREIAGAALITRKTIGQYTLMDSNTNLNLLGDWIRLYPVPEAYSLGDVFVAIGLAVAVFIATATPARIVS